MKKISRANIEKLISKKLSGNDISVFLIILQYAEEKKGAFYIPQHSLNSFFCILSRNFPHISRSAFYASVKRLEAFGLISYRKEKGVIFVNDQELIAAFEGDFKTKGYITLPDFVFSRDFHELSLAGKRLVLKLLSLLNGSVNHKPVRLDPSDPALMSLLRKNFPQQVRNVFEEIKIFFKIIHNDNDIFECKISKKAFEFKLVLKYVSPLNIFKRVYKLIERFFKRWGYDYTLSELEALVMAFRRFKKKEIYEKLKKYIRLETTIHDLEAYFSSF
ncbi:hypothetical protein [Caldanaerobacter subterraneus]|uniref:Uncharacterized protein n=1 Tax=Caldanaerobacter subterraneus TaxID=911092 RepID=A0A7Y2L6A7_9THEO|nr:hypothetical protein [Caldanaerobacter subterraneus]NNG66452.1 hypothetical protein [Caldanaerobacter subterraneus]